MQRTLVHRAAIGQVVRAPGSDSKRPDVDEDCNEHSHHEGRNRDLVTATASDNNL